MHRLPSFLLVVVLFNFSALAMASDGPHPLKPADYWIGKQIKDVPFVDLDGRAGRLSDYGGNAAIVLALNKINCPLSKKYFPTLNRLAKEYAARNVTFLLVNVDKHATPDELRMAVQAAGITARYLPDLENAIPRAIPSLTTTDVFILDRTRTLIYRGPVDDQYGLTYSLPAPRREHLREALEAHLEGRENPQPAWSAPGCALKIPVDPETEPATYHNRISRLFQRNCQECHRPGENGPFPLLTYRDAVSHAPMIEFMVARNLMPPWFANPKYGAWANDRSLVPADKEALLKWIADGMPEGEATDAPAPIAWTPGWKMGPPDATVSIPEPIKVPATGVMPYQYVIVKNPFGEDKWVEAVEIRVTAPQVVHHVVVLLRVPTNDGAEEGFFAVYVPGNAVSKFPAGVARFLPKNAELIFQIHYTPNGSEAFDQPKLGMRFLKEKPKFELSATSAYNTKFKIPPHHPSYEVTAEHALKKRTRVYSFMPHMHLRGKAFRFEAVHPDGRTEILLDIPRYDFNWQLLYELREPLDFEAGTKIKATAWYDNSDKNPHNPDPTKEVTWGEQTHEEMMIGYLNSHPLE